MKGILKLHDDRIPLTVVQSSHWVYDPHWWMDTVKSWGAPPPPTQQGGGVRYKKKNKYFF